MRILRENTSGARRVYKEEHVTGRKDSSEEQFARRSERCSGGWQVGEGTIEHGAPGRENSTGTRSHTKEPWGLEPMTEGVHGPRRLRRALEAVLKMLSLF